ncbi:MAG: hypothetical protein CMP08_00600 [Xanthomonadales bacterium]|nr:hypothetical protein [Xanthomonadales bacterium]
MAKASRPATRSCCRPTLAVPEPEPDLSMTSRDTAVERGPGAITYRRLEILSATAHRELRLAPQSDYRFAAATAQVPLVAEEITEAAKHFPIVFTRDGDDIQPVALMSLSENTNVFVGRDGRWQARYVPAWLRRYPFAFARQAGVQADTSATTDDAERLVVMIDRGAPHFSAGAGQPLFVAAGPKADDGLTRGPAMDQALDYLERYRRASVSVAGLVSGLGKAQVLVERSLDVFTKTEHANRIGGLQIVDRERLMALSDIQLGQ